MAIVTVNSSCINQLQKFDIRCLKCGSGNVEIEIDWACYPSSTWNNTTIICKDCHEDEVIHED